MAVGFRMDFHLPYQPNASTATGIAVTVYWCVCMWGCASEIIHECKCLPVAPNAWLCAYEIREHTHLFLYVFIATITSYTTENTQICRGRKHLWCCASFLSILGATLGDLQSQHLIFDLARLDMEPSTWWLGKYFVFQSQWALRSLWRSKASCLP